MQVDIRTKYLIHLCLFVSLYIYIDTHLFVFEVIVLWSSIDVMTISSCSHFLQILSHVCPLFAELLQGSAKLHFFQRYVEIDCDNCDPTFEDGLL